jgi:hypothetical protein
VSSIDQEFAGIAGRRLARVHGFSRSLGPSGARQFGGGMSVVPPVAISIAIRLVLAGIR